MIKRETAERYVQDVIQRAREINQGAYAWRVEQIEVFGSYLTDKPVLGDIDLMVTLVPRYADPDQHEQILLERQKTAPSKWIRARPSWARAYWPVEEVHQAIRGQNKSISIHTADERQPLIDGGAEFESIFDA